MGDAGKMTLFFTTIVLIYVGFFVLTLYGMYQIYRDVINYECASYRSINDTAPKYCYKYDI